MWLCLNNAFLSIVQPKPGDRAPGGTLLVRARRADDIERIFPGYAAVTEPRRDYQFRAFIPRTVVGAIIAAQLEAITYTNFKASVRNPRLHDAYGDFWSIMAKLQPQRPYSDYRTATRKEPDLASRRVAGFVRAELVGRAEPSIPALGKLHAMLPPEFLTDSYERTPAYQLRDHDVIERHVVNEGGKRWPGPQMYVNLWLKLANGKAVGWNENPQRGYSFPVVTLS